MTGRLAICAQYSVGQRTFAQMIGWTVNGRLLIAPGGGVGLGTPVPIGLGKGVVEVRNADGVHVLDAGLVED